jgi:hypothetical protein
VIRANAKTTNVIATTTIISNFISPNAIITNSILRYYYKMTTQQMSQLQNAFITNIT